MNKNGKKNMEEAEQDYGSEHVCYALKLTELTVQLQCPSFIWGYLSSRGLQFIKH